MKLAESVNKLIREDIEELKSLSKEVIAELKTELASYTEDWPDEVFTAEVGTTIINRHGEIYQEPDVNSVVIIDPYELLVQTLDSYDKTIEKKFVKDSDYQEIFSVLDNKEYELKSNVNFREVTSEDSDKEAGDGDIFFTIKVISLKYDKHKGIIEVKNKASKFNL